MTLKNRLTIWFFLAFCAFITAGLIRIYVGSSIGFQVVLKESFSYKDTYVCLDDIFGMPRIAVASKHPAVKRQLEQMRIIRTDNQVKTEVRAEFQKEWNDAMEKAKEEAKELMEELDYYY